MKLLTALLALFFFPLSLHTAPCYGTKMPKKKQFFAGTETYNIFNRYQEDERGKMRSLQHFLNISYGLFDWLSIDLKGGAGYIKQHPLGRDEIDYPSGFAGGYGLRFRLYDSQKTKVVFGFQHISVHPGKVILDEDKEHTAILDDWQTSLLVSYDLQAVTPYIGTRWSRVDYIHWIEENRNRRMSDRTKSWGLIWGCDIPVLENIWLNLEGQAFDSLAASFSINYSF